MDHIKRLKMDKIVQAVAGVHGLTIDEMHGTKRDRHLVDARRQAAVIIKDLLGYASTYIGRYFNKNHATILHHLKANKQIIDYDYIYRDKFILAKNTALDFIDKEPISDEELISTLTKEINKLKMQLKDQQKFIDNIITKSNEYKNSKAESTASDQN